MSSFESNSDVFYRPGVEPAVESMFSGHDDFRDQLMSRNGRIALVMYSRERQNFKELSVEKGEYLEVMDDTKKWWHCKNSSGETGYAPHTLLKALIYTDVSPYALKLSKLNSSKSVLYVQTFEGSEDERSRNVVRRSTSSRSRRRSLSPSSSSRGESPPPPPPVLRRPRSPSPARSIPPPAPPMPIREPSRKSDLSYSLGSVAL